MRRLGNVATPDTAGTGSPPERVAFFVTLPSLPTVTLTGPVKLLTLFPRESYAVTWTGGLIGSPARALPSDEEKATRAGGAWDGGPFPPSVKSLSRWQLTATRATRARRETVFIS